MSASERPAAVNSVGHEVRDRSGARGRGLPVVKGLLISFVTILVFLGCLEFIAFRWETNLAQGPLGWTLVASRRMPVVRHGTADQPYDLLQPNRDYQWSGISVHIDSRGFRSPEFSVPKPRGTYRILNLGDSVVFGWSVQEEDTYGRKLEAALNSRNDGRHFEVINAGIPGWGPQDELNFLRQEGLSYQPDLVLLDVTLDNDITQDPLASSVNSGFFAFLRDHTYSWPFVTTETRFLLARRYGPEAIPVLNPPTDASAYFPLNVDSPRYDAIWKVYTQMIQVSQARGVPFTIVIFPTAFQLNSRAHPDVPQRALESRATRAGVQVVDLLPTFRQACLAAPPGSCEGYENLLFADVWMHPNRLGHALTARTLDQLIH